MVWSKVRFVREMALAFVAVELGEISPAKSTVYRFPVAEQILLSECCMGTIVAVEFVGNPSLINAVRRFPVAD